MYPSLGLAQRALSEAAKYALDREWNQVPAVEQPLTSCPVPRQDVRHCHHQPPGRLVHAGQDGYRSRVESCCRLEGRVDQGLGQEQHVS